MLSITRFLRGCVFLFFFIAIPSLVSAKSDFDSLSVRSAEEFVFAHTESEFVLSVPGVEPSKIQAELPELPGDVRFVSSKKEFDGNGGTTIRFWLYFSSVGNFELPPIVLRRGFGVHYIPFEKISVTENPALVNPRLFVSVEKKGSFREGQSIFFTLYAQYAAQILDFSYKLPKDSIFFEKERLFSGSETKKRPFSTEAVPLAKFEWKPLRAGTYVFPEMQIDALAYNGNRKTVSLPRKEIEVLEGNLVKEKKSDALSDFYESPETELSQDEKSAEILTFGEAENDFSEECEALYELRSKERYGFPLSPSFSKNVAKRKNIEKIIGISLSENERNFWVMNFLFVLTGVFIVLFVLFLSGRHTKMLVIFFSLFVLSLSASVIYEIEFAKRFGVFCGGFVGVIPEELDEGEGRFVPAGLRVKIIEKSSDWVYIETVDCSGWVKSDFVKELM